jgi:hypothetical protein
VSQRPIYDVLKIVLEDRPTTWCVRAYIEVDMLHQGPERIARGSYSYSRTKKSLNFFGLDKTFRTIGEATAYRDALVAEDDAIKRLGGDPIQSRQSAIGKLGHL